MCTDNVQRIQDNYNDMFIKIKNFPKNEQELFILKSFIQQHEHNIHAAPIAHRSRQRLLASLEHVREPHKIAASRHCT